MRRTLILQQFYSAIILLIRVYPDLSGRPTKTLNDQQQQGGSILVQVYKDRIFGGVVGLPENIQGECAIFKFIQAKVNYKYL